MKKYVLIIMVIFTFVLFGCDKGVTVKFDTQGGTEIASQDVTETGLATKPEDPMKIGYAFMGWELDGKEFNFDTKIEKSITLKAKWVLGVDLEFTGAGIEDFTLTVPLGQDYTLPVPEREGYEFLAWVDPDTDEEYVGTIAFNEPLFLEAKWHKIEIYNLVYRDGDKTLKSVQITEGEKVEEFTPTKEGYTFDGWYTNTNYTKKFDFENLTRSNAVYAKFIANEFTVSFATLPIAKAITVAYDSPYGALPTINITNARFIGWEYEGKRVFESDIYKFTKDIELEPIIFVTSTFVVEDVSTKVEYQVGTPGPYVDVQVFGKMFAGWYTTPNFTDEGVYNITDTKYANKTLYAYLVGNVGNDDVKKDIVRNVIDYYQDLLQDKIIYEDIELLNNDKFYGATIKWTSDSNLVSTSGKITRTKQNEKVSLTAEIIYNGYSETATYNITLKENLYRDISKNVVVSYVYTANMGNGLNDMFFETVDVINLAFATCDVDGSLTLDANYVGILNRYKEKAKENGVRFVLVIGPPSDPKRFEAIGASAELRKKFAKNVVDAINEYGFQGVDVDWEYPTEATKGNYTLLIKELYEQVKNNDPEHLVTSAIPAGPYSYPKFDLKNSVQYLDYINMMSYDMQSDSTTTHHAALYRNSSVGVIGGCSIDESVATFTGKTQGVPLNKIVIGAAFYGRKAPTTKTITGDPLNKAIPSDEKATSVTYTAIKNSYLTKSTCKEYWDDKAKAPYCYDTATNTFISYDNPKSIKLKCQYVSSKGVRGIMWWDSGSDTTGDLLTAVNESLSIMKK